MPTNSKYVKTKIIPGNEEDFIYPENKIPEFQSKKNWGLAFSGGGTRSATLTLGQLRALKQMGILDEFKYCSSVSGGTWGLTPFIYLDKSIEDDEFLGIYLPPDILKKSDLSIANNKSLASAISNSKIIKSLFSHLFTGDEIFSRIVGDIFLKPFLLNENIFFTLNDTTLNEILNDNDHLSQNDFYTVSERNRPFLIVNTTILRNVDLRIPFEMTPLYIGIKKLYENAGSNQKYDIGGGFVEPHGFDSDAPDDIISHPYSVRINRNKLSISDMLGSSGAAPADFLRRFIPQSQLFSNFNYWSPIASEKRMKEKGYDFGDGGLLENLGIMPLLRRKVEKIIVFVNGKTLLQKLENSEDYSISSSIPALFKKIPNQYGARDFETNIVFEDPLNEKYSNLTNSLYQKQKKGLPTIHIDSYKVKQNNHHDIVGGWDVDVCWVYNSRPSNWEENLNYEVKRSLVNQDYGSDFPFFKTFEENFPYIIDLSLEQTQLASQLASWMLIESQNEILEFLS